MWIRRYVTIRRLFVPCSDNLWQEDDMNIDWVEEMDKEGAPILEDDHLCRDICIEVTCPSKKLDKRRAVAYNIDFDWN